MMIDISDQMSAETGLRESDVRFRMLFAAAPMALFVCNRDAVILDYNDLAADLWGRRPLRGVEKHCGSVRLWLPDGAPLPHASSPIVEVLRTGAPAGNFELHIERPDGSRLPLLANFTAITDTLGEVSGAIASYVDISERKQTEEAAQRLAAIVESSDDAIVAKNLDGIITSWNSGAERIFGYLAEEAIGRPVAMLIPPDRENEEPQILDRLKRGIRIDHYETIRRRKDGSMIVVSLTVSPIKNARGQIIGASKIARDITDKKRKDDQIALLTREVEHRSKNLLATILATVNLTNADSADELKSNIQGRIKALADANTLLAELRWQGVGLDSLIRQELAPYCKDDDSRCRLAGEAELLEPDTAQSIAMVLHELATNAAKYGSVCRCAPALSK